LESSIWRMSKARSDFRHFSCELLSFVNRSFVRCCTVSPCLPSPSRFASHLLEISSFQKLKATMTSRT
jgi:hypothetical protein